MTEEREDLGFFDPERLQGQTLHDIRIDEGDDPKYVTEHYHVSVRLPETQYLELMRSLNKQQNEICTHIIQHLDTSNEQMFLYS